MFTITLNDGTVFRYADIQGGSNGADKGFELLVIHMDGHKWINTHDIESVVRTDDPNRIIAEKLVDEVLASQRQAKM